MVSYEESRRRRLEENKRRMEELNLHKLSASLRTATSPKSSPVTFTSRLLFLGTPPICIFIYLDSQVKKPRPITPRSPVILSAVRRSSRFVDKPSPNYKEVSSLLLDSIFVMRLCSVIDMFGILLKCFHVL